MRKLSAIVPLVIFAALFPFIAPAEDEPSQEMGVLSHIIPGAVGGSIFYQDGRGYGTNGVYVRDGDTMLTAETISWDRNTGEAAADGHVHISEKGQIWVGEHIRYNTKTHLMQSEEFRTGNNFVFAEGGQLQGDVSNRVYTARHAYITSDDVDDPAIRVRASRVRIVPGRYIEMWNALLCLNGVPVAYFPYYRRNLGGHSSNLNFVVGDSSAFGPYLLSSYTWYLNDEADGQFHMDYRERRGFGVGPDVHWQLGQWGDAKFSYYYLHDVAPNLSTNFSPLFGNMPKNRQRVLFEYQATPATNLDLKALVNYQTDPLVLHDFFPSDYGANPQPNTFVEVNRRWANWSLDAEAIPRANTFFDQVERLPDVKLTGFRQQIFDTPLYYQSESSLGHYRTFYANTNGLYLNTNATPLDYSASRGDTYQQLLLPHTFFDWLNITPRAGGRFTYYSEENGPGGTNAIAYREVFDTGMEASFKVSRLWTTATNSFLDLDGLRHVLEPSVNYVYVPRPNVLPAQLPQFDSEIPGLVILPVQFPDYNDIDSIDSRNVLRFGLRNTLQTKRGGKLENLLDLNVLLDWRLRPDAGQSTFNDLYSDVAFRPRTWITLDSQVRYDINDGLFNTTFHQLTLQPNQTWSWGLGYWYARDGFLNSTGADFLTSTMFFRLNENWGFRAQHYFNAQDGRLEQQFYTIYRDFRSWTGALTFHLLKNSTGPQDFGVAFTFSLKAEPRYHLGSDTVNSYHLIGE